MKNFCTFSAHSSPHDDTLSDYLFKTKAMLQRTKGRLLLTLLVISGLAGTLKNTSISKKERKYSINLMKDTKTDVLQTVKGLTDAQLNFKPSVESWSVKECMYHIAITEKSLWGMLEGAMKAGAN